MFYVLIVGEQIPSQTVYIADPLYADYLARRRAADRGYASVSTHTPAPLDTLDTDWSAQ